MKSVVFVYVAFKALFVGLILRGRTARASV